MYNSTDSRLTFAIKHVYSKQKDIPMAVYIILSCSKHKARDPTEEHVTKTNGVSPMSIS